MLRNKQLILHIFREANKYKYITPCVDFADVCCVCVFLYFPWNTDGGFSSFGVLYLFIPLSFQKRHSDITHKCPKSTKEKGKRHSELVGTEYLFTRTLCPSLKPNPLPYPFPHSNPVLHLLSSNCDRKSVQFCVLIGQEVVRQ